MCIVSNIHNDRLLTDVLLKTLVVEHERGDQGRVDEAREYVVESLELVSK